MKKTKYMKFIMLAAIATLTACSGGAQIKPVNELPSYIEVASVNFSTGAWKLRLTHRHKENRINSKIGCDLHTDTDQTLAFSWIDLPELSYQLSEIIDIPDMPTNITTPEKMPDTLNYKLTCELISDNFHPEMIYKNSVLHRVPGKQSVYR